MGRYLDSVTAGGGPSLVGLRHGLALVGRRARRVLAVDLGPLRGRGPRRRPGPPSPTPGCPAPAGSPARRSTTPSTRSRCPGATADDVVVVGRSQTRGPVDLTADELRDAVARCRAGLERLGVRRGDRVAAYLPNDPRGARRVPGHRVARRDLVVVRAGVRDAGRRRPLRPDRAARAAHRRRLSLRRPRHRPGARRSPRSARRCRPFGRRSSSPTCATRRARSRPSPGAIAWSRAASPMPGRSPSSRSRSTTRCTSSSRRGRPACRRRSSTATAGSCSSTCKALALHTDLGPDGPLLLVHDHRLDDVELPRLGARSRARPSCCSTATPPGPTCRRCGAWPPRRAPPTSAPSAPFLMACRKAGLAPGADPTLDLASAARHRLDRRAAAGGRLPVGPRAVSDAIPLGSLSRRHGPVHRVPRAVAARPGLGGRDQLPDARRAGRGVRSRRAGRSSARRASS